MPSVLIVGATRGLGASLTKQYASQPSNTVFATARSKSSATEQENVTWIHDIDLTKSDVGDKLVSQLQGTKLDIVVSSTRSTSICACSFPSMST